MVLKYLALLWALSVSTAAWAGGISVSHAWIRLLPGNLPAGGYAVLSNDFDHNRVLVGASAPDFARAMLHQSVTRNGQDKMIHVARIPITAGATFRFAPGGYHIMLMPPHTKLEPGDRVPVIFVFADGAEIKASFMVKGAGAINGD